MKKVVSFLLTISFIGILSILLCACGESKNDEECEHVWNREQQTCTESRRCVLCGIEEAPLEHDLTPAGYIKDSRCKRCGYVAKGTAILNENEGKIYYAITNELSNFKDPASVQLIEVRKTEELYRGNEETYYYLTIAAKNSYGGRVQNEYYIRQFVYQDTLRRDRPTAYEKQAVSDVDVSKINKGIKEYIKEQGWE